MLNYAKKGKNVWFWLISLANSIIMTSFFSNQLPMLHQMLPDGDMLHYYRAFIFVKQNKTNTKIMFPSFIEAH